MDTIKVDRKGTKMIAHRGVSGLEPENSIPAFVAAGNRSYYGVETDIHVSGDGRIVVIHDERTARVAVEDINIEESTFDQIRKIRLRDICGLDRRGGLTAADKESREDLVIPSLAEYINICKKYDKKCVVELKNQFARGDVHRLVEEIRQLDYLDSVIFISFFFDNMLYLRSELPQQPLQFLTTVYNEEVLSRLNQYDLDIDIAYSALTEEILDQLHSHGHRVNVWTVDDPQMAEQLIGWGVDYLTSNILE